MPCRVIERLSCVCFAEALIRSIADLSLRASLCALFLLCILFPPVLHAAENAPGCNIAVDFSKQTGKIRALHGVNNGPVSWGLSADLTEYHKTAGFPSARLHDCNYAGQNVVDIHFIFPIFDADADDPKYYRFAETDAYIAGMVELGERITYRLGESIESRSRTYSNGGFHVQPPKDFGKWAKICVNIIRHYNDGWANGFHYGIKYWEIWNEPAENVAGMWPGTQQQYFEMYEAAARAIKAHDSSLKVGGPASCNINFPIVVPFLAYCRDRQVPLDFMTWHCYAAAPEIIVKDSFTARKVADEYGFKEAESHITEWHPMWYNWDGEVGANERGDPNPVKYAAMREKFNTMRGPKAAAFVASTLMLLQDAPLDMANYYTADTNPWGMFDSFGVPGRVYHAFVAFNQLITTPNRVSCVQQGEPAPEVTACAGISDDTKTVSILISNFSTTPRATSVQLQGLSLSQPVEVEIFAVDALHACESISQSVLMPDQSNLHCDIPENAVFLVRLKL